jgi:hypothetical protein
MDRNFPYFTHLEVFRCTTYALILKESRHKLESKKNTLIGIKKISTLFKILRS